MIAARQHVNRDEDRPKNVKIFGTDFVWADAIDAKHAEEKMIIKVAMALEEFAADTMALQSWDPAAIKGQG